MFFVYLDEFGHIGPFVSRTNLTYNESPIFGLAGIILPEQSVRVFATKILQLKEFMFDSEIARSGKISQIWEKKGRDIFRPRAVSKYQSLRSCGFRLLNYLRDCDGSIFYYGREKVIGKLDGNSNGLHTTVLSHAIRRIDNFCVTQNQNFALVIDEHSAKKELLECAAKTMYGTNPARKLVSPPFEVESYLN